MSKHTPGPWIATKAGPTMAGYSQGDAIASIEHNTLVAGCFSDVKGGPEIAEANAKLIAAAPELLAFAKAFLASWTAPGPTDSPLEAQAHAAIAKAEAP